MKSILLFILLYYGTTAETPCKDYSECRLNLLSRRFNCLEQPRKAVERICKLKEDLRIVWKSSLWREKLVTSCLLQDKSAPPPVSFCSLPTAVDTESDEQCGLSLKLLEERCDLMRSCCQASDKNLKHRTQLAMQKTMTCSRRIFAAVQTNMTQDDIVIARSIVQRTTIIRELLSSLAQKPVGSFAPLPPLAPLLAVHGTRSQPILNVGQESRGPPADEPERKEAVLRVQTAGFQSQTASLNKAFFAPIHRNPLKKRKAKTLFTQLLQKRRGTSKPWREARPRSVQSQSLPGLTGYRLNTSRVISAYTLPVSKIRFNEDVWRGRVEEIPEKTTETTLKPVYLAMRFVDRRTRRGRKRWEWQKEKSSEKSTSEEDFEKEFERKAGSLVSFGPNALPLPGSKKSTSIDDPFQGIVERQELHIADISDITTPAPLRSKLEPVYEERPLKIFKLTTASPLHPPPGNLWDPLLAFFSTPAPFYLSTAFPIKLWPFRKAAAAHGVKTMMNGTEFEVEEVLPAPLSPNSTEKQGHRVVEELPAVEITVTNTTADTVSLEKGNCLRYQTCLRILEGAEKECERKPKPRPDKKQSVCLNLERKFQIMELVKTIDGEYRRCIWNDTDGYSIGGGECTEMPALPTDFYLYKTCSKKMTELRRHCEQASRCCSAVERCQSETASSSLVAELKMKRRRMEAMRSRCRKRNNRNTVPRVEGVAQLGRQ